MNTSGPNAAGQHENSRHWPPPAWLIGLGCLLIALIALLLPRPNAAPTDGTALTNATPLATARSEHAARKRSVHRRLNSASGSDQVQTPEEIVANKVKQFGRKRRELVRAIARRSNKEVPSEVEAFFDAIEAGNWEDIHLRWQSLANQSAQYDHSTTHAPELDAYWPAVLDAYGVAEQAHEWPAQQLLDYGNAVLDSLRPDMVYVGGTDYGRWVPELLNETSGGEPRVVVTQNALADGRYMEFVNELYSDRLATLTTDETRRAFEEYTADAQKRFQHDQEFPDEPKQMRPGENVSVGSDGKFTVTGQVAVMAINERLLEALMAKNPGLSFAVEESFPMRGTYANAVPLGPLMELRAPDAQSAFTAERAAQSVDYWRTVTQNVLGDPEAANSLYALKSYSHDANAAANLLAARNFNAEAEQAYRLSSQLWPANPEPIGGLAAVLAGTGRADEARRMIDDFTRAHPDQLSAMEKFRGSIVWTATAPPLTPSP